MRSGHFPRPRSDARQHRPLSRLRTLLHRPGRVFSREELLTAMFGGNRPSDPHTINTHIRALRHKLRAAGIADEHIRTHHGLGYSFNET
ncbi:helix-turn-helix domain-containing protein [Eikenella sp. NML03-A-027]|uniref:winged helix-turn-helix domain-containing protein n=1 Tax=Eikenella sp. NML03-A-027 TaxID=1795828 RepID=UPI003510021E